MAVATSPWLGDDDGRRAKSVVVRSRLNLYDTRSSISITKHQCFHITCSSPKPRIQAKSNTAATLPACLATKHLPVKRFPWSATTRRHGSSHNAAGTFPAQPRDERRGGRSSR